MSNGQYVKRSTFQQIAEENKKLLKDIEMLTKDEPIPSFQKIKLIKKWREHFEKQDEFWKYIGPDLRQYLKDNPGATIEKK